MVMNLLWTIRFPISYIYVFYTCCLEYNNNDNKNSFVLFFFSYMLNKCNLNIFFYFYQPNNLYIYFIFHFFCHLKILPFIFFLCNQTYRKVIEQLSLSSLVYISWSLSLHLIYWFIIKILTCKITKIKSKIIKKKKKEKPAFPLFCVNVFFLPSPWKSINTFATFASIAIDHEP